MKREKNLFGGIIFLVAAVMVFPCFLPNALAFREGGGGRVGGGEREGELSEGARGGEVAEGPRGGEVAEGPRGGVAAEGYRGVDVAVGPEGRAIARGPGGNVYAGRVGDRVNVLPETAEMLAWGNQTYYVDGATYYLPCQDDNTVYCVVPSPQ